MQGMGFNTQQTSCVLFPLGAEAGFVELKHLTHIGGRGETHQASGETEVSHKYGPVK